MRQPMFVSTTKMVFWWEHGYLQKFLQKMSEKCFTRLLLPRAIVNKWWVLPTILLWLVIFGVNRTCDKISAHFFCPNLYKDLLQFCKTWHACEIIGKPNYKTAPAPLMTILAFVEPLVVSSLIVLVPCQKQLRNITSPVIVEALIKFFTMMGLPKVAQYDQGSNFRSGLFQKVLLLGNRQVKCIVYHPESQGGRERYNLLKHEKDLLFVKLRWRRVKTFSWCLLQLGIQFSPFELVFGYMDGGPLKHLKGQWLNVQSELN